MYKFRTLVRGWGKRRKETCAFERGLIGIFWVRRRKGRFPVYFGCSCCPHCRGRLMWKIRAGSTWYITLMFLRVYLDLWLLIQALQKAKRDVKLTEESKLPFVTWAFIALTKFLTTIVHINKMHRFLRDSFLNFDHCVGSYYWQSN